MATVEAVNTVAPVLQFVHVDHLHRPVKMTNAAEAVIWDASVRSTARESVAAGHAEGMQEIRRAAQPDGSRDVKRAFADLFACLRRDASGSSPKPACITTGTGATIQRWVATPNPTPSGSSMVRVYMGMRVEARCDMWTLRVDLYPTISRRCPPQDWTTDDVKLFGFYGDAPNIPLHWRVSRTGLEIFLLWLPADESPCINGQVFWLLPKSEDSDSIRTVAMSSEATAQKRGIVDELIPLTATFSVSP